MAVKLSSYYWFRNNYLMESLEDEVGERTFFGKKLAHKDRKILKFIIKELDELKDDSYFQKGSPLINEHVIISNIVELKDVTSNVELASAYFQGIHQIMKQYWVQIELYRQLGNCFDELGLHPNPDITEVVKYAKDKIRFKEFASLDRMCWQTIKEHKARRI